jgi:NADH-quinone oxidoreductase subunit F
MDLHWIDAEPSEEERAAVDSVVGAPDRPEAPGHALEEHIIRGGVADTRSKRHLLLPALNAVQARVGWVSRGAIDYICRRLTIPPAEAYGVATFYALLSTEPRPPRVAHVCDDIACKLAGADALCETLEKTVGAEGAATQNGKDGKATWLRSPCLGQCERGPAVLFQLAGEDDWTLTEATTEAVRKGLKKTPAKIAPRPSTPQTQEPRAPGLRLLRRVGVANPESLDDYREHGGYQALRRAIEMGSEYVLRVLSASSWMRWRGHPYGPTT